jgi:hypothetical protein
MDYVLKSSIHTVIGETIIADIRSQRSAYYFFVGGLDNTNGTSTPYADDTYGYELGVRNQIVSLKQIQDSDVSFVVPRIDWVSGNVYDQYDDYSPTYPAASGATSIDAALFYVVTDEYKVYKCLYNYNGAKSTVKPTSTLAAPFYTSDGYRWKFMYLIPLSARNRFMNNAFMPVQTALLDNFYSAGQILTTAILNKGTGYINATILVDGDGQGASLRAVVSNGQIIQVIVDEPGTGYTYANLTVSGDGTGASIVATLSVGDLDTAQADVELLAQRGSIEAYRITNGGSGYQALTAATNGTTNGTTNQFQLTDGGSVVTNAQNVAVYRTYANGLGKFQQYTTPRTNLALDSQFQSLTPWGHSISSITKNARVAPDGTMTGATVTCTTAGNDYIWQNINGDYHGATVTASVWLYGDGTARSFNLFLKDSAGNNVVGATVTPPVGVWTRYSVTNTYPANAPTNYIGLYVDPVAASTLGQTYGIWGAQVEVNQNSTSLIPTTTAAVTVTDIQALTVDGRVTFTSNPNNGDIITWAGKYVPSTGGQALQVTNSPVVSLDTLSGPTCTIDGDGTGAAGYPVISNGQIAGIIVTNPGTGYTNAKVTISGNGQGAKAVAIYAPPGGHGKNAINELKATRLSFFSNLLNDKNQGVEVSARFTTIGLLRNPSEYSSDRLYSKLMASGCNYITYSGPTPTQYDVFTERTTGSRFQVVQLDGISGMLLQNLDNYDLPSNSALLNTNSGGQITVMAVTDPSIDKFSGDLMFIDNFAINQQAGQQIIIFKTTLKF